MNSLAESYRGSSWGSWGGPFSEGLASKVGSKSVSSLGSRLEAGQVPWWGLLVSEPVSEPLLHPPAVGDLQGSSLRAGFVFYIMAQRHCQTHMVAMSKMSAH